MSDSDEDSLLQTAFNNRNHDIMESIFRDMTLKRAVTEGDSNEAN